MSDNISHVTMPKEVIKCAPRKVGVKWLHNTITMKHVSAQVVEKTAVTDSKAFCMNVWLNQASILSFCCLWSKWMLPGRLASGELNKHRILPN